MFACRADKPALGNQVSKSAQRKVSKLKTSYKSVGRTKFEQAGYETLTVSSLSRNAQVRRRIFCISSIARQIAVIHELRSSIELA